MTLVKSVTEKDLAQHGHKGRGRGQASSQLYQVERKDVPSIHLPLPKPLMGS